VPIYGGGQYQQTGQSKPVEVVNLFQQDGQSGAAYAHAYSGINDQLLQE